MRKEYQSVPVHAKSKAWGILLRRARAAGYRGAPVDVRDGVSDAYVRTVVRVRQPAGRPAIRWGRLVWEKTR